MFHSTDTTPSQQLLELTQLTGELAHEIKNPLSTLKVNLKLVQEQLEEAAPCDDRCARVLRKITVIKEEAERLEAILDGFLKYIGKVELQLSVVDVNLIVNDIVDFYLPQAFKHGITLRQGLYADPLPCKLDPSMIKQVLLNMFINAQEAMPEGGDLMVKTDKSETRAIIFINDTGCSIEPNNLNRIFRPYFSSKPKGTGLGLAIAHKIISAHGGTISVESERGKGTSFSIHLPLYTG